MNNEKLNQIIDKAYENYQWKQPKSFPAHPDSNLSKEEFINKCKVDSEFSERWGLKIEERELSLEERYVWYIQTHNKNLTRSSNQFDMYDILNSNNCPTKLITITYNNIKTEIYEN